MLGMRSSSTVLFLAGIAVALLCRAGRAQEKEKAKEDTKTKLAKKVKQVGPFDAMPLDEMLKYVSERWGVNYEYDRDAFQKKLGFSEVNTQPIKVEKKYTNVSADV